MGKEKPIIDFEETVSSCNELLCWIRNNRMGFVEKNEDEISSIKGCIEELRSITNFNDLLRISKKIIRDCLQAHWNSAQIKRKFKKYKRNTDRARVLSEFPEKLRALLKKLEMRQKAQNKDTVSKLISSIRDTLLQTYELFKTGHSDPLTDSSIDDETKERGEETGVLTRDALREMLNRKKEE